jgi:hypothetical protein
MGGTTDKPTPKRWPWPEALKRAGGFEELQPHLRDGHFPLYYPRIFSWPEGKRLDGPGQVPPASLATARIDLLAGWLIFTREVVRLSVFTEKTRVEAETVYAIANELELGDGIGFERIFSAPEPRQACPRRPETKKGEDGTDDPTLDAAMQTPEVAATSRPGRKPGRLSPQRAMCEMATDILNSDRRRPKRRHGRRTAIARIIQKDKRFEMYKPKTIAAYIHDIVVAWEEHNPGT